MKRRRAWNVGAEAAWKGCALLFVARFAPACSHSQSAPTPASGMGASTVSQVSSTSRTAAPWKSTTSAPSAPTVESLTTPMDAAMVLCTTVLSLEPCGLITTGVGDTLGCFAACKTQIETVAKFRVERAALECASSPPPPDDTPRACNLGLPPGTALDVEALGRECDARCKELAELLPKSLDR